MKCSLVIYPQFRDQIVVAGWFFVLFLFFVFLWGEFTPVSFQNLQSTSRYWSSLCQCWLESSSSPFSSAASAAASVRGSGKLRITWNTLAVKSFLWPKEEVEWWWCWGHTMGYYSVRLAWHRYLQRTFSLCCT